MQRPITTIVFSSAVVLCACSSKEAAKPDSAAIAQAGAGGANANASFDPTTRVASVIAKDFAFVAPDSITAGWTTFRMKNNGTLLHHVAIARIDSGKTMADVEAALKNPGPPPAWLVGVGGPNASDPGAESNATLNLQPGQYVMLCFVDIPEHVPHFAKGMVHPFIVTAANGSTGTEPTADATITVADYSFAVDGKLSAGKHTIRVLDKGPQEHEVVIMRLAPGKTMKDFGAWAVKMEGPPPGSALGGVVGVSTAAGPNYFDVELTPGDYALLCFIPDAKDGKPHIEHGMVKEFKVE